MHRLPTYSAKETSRYVCAASAGCTVGRTACLNDFVLVLLAAMAAAHTLTPSTFFPAALLLCWQHRHLCLGSPLHGFKTCPLGKTAPWPWLLSVRTPTLLAGAGTHAARLHFVCLLSCTPLTNASTVLQPQHDLPHTAKVAYQHIHLTNFRQMHQQSPLPLLTVVLLHVLCSTTSAFGLHKATVTKLPAR